MVDIPLIKRQYNDTPNAEAQANFSIPTVNNVAGEQLSKTLGEGVDYFQKRVEAISNDEANKAYNLLREEFNQGYNVGYDNELGLRNIEGYDSFKGARSKLQQRLEKKRDELINREGLSSYTREIIKRKLDDGFSTFQYYMDTQEGQVKTVEATKNHQIARQHKDEDVAALFSLYNGTPQANKLLQMKIQELEEIDGSFFYARGLATKDESGKFILSPIAQAELQKNMHNTVKSSILTLATKNTAAAKEAMRNFGQYIIPTEQVKITKALEEKEMGETAYGLAYNAIVKQDGNAEYIKSVEENYLKKNDMEGLKEFRTQVSRIRTETAKSEKDASADGVKALKTWFLNLPLEEAAKITDIRAAKNNDTFFQTYVNLTPSDQDRIQRFIENNPVPDTKSFAALNEAILNGASSEIITERLGDIPKKYRDKIWNRLAYGKKSGTGADVETERKWKYIVDLAKKGEDDTIVDLTDADNMMEAHAEWIDKTVGHDFKDKQETERLVQEFVAERRKKNQGWFGSLFSSNKPLDTGRKFGETNPIGKPKNPDTIARAKKYIDQGMSAADALKKVKEEDKNNLTSR